RQADVLAVEGGRHVPHLARPRCRDLVERLARIPGGAELPVGDRDEGDPGAPLAAQPQQGPEAGALVVLVGEDADDVHDSAPGRSVIRSESPPSTRSVVPVMNSAAGEARKATAAPMSAGCPSRPQGCLRSAASSCSSVYQWLSPGVRIQPGSTTL